MLNSPRIDGGIGFAKSEFRPKPDATDIAPPTGLRIGGSGFAYPNLSSIGNVGLCYAGLNATINVR